MNHLRTIAATFIVLISTVASARAQDPANDKVIGMLLAAGDIAKCGDEPRHLKDEATAEILKEEVERAKSKNIPVRIIALGDLAYDTGTDGQFKCFDASWGAHKDIMLPVPGNHEYTKETNPDGAPYFRYFAQTPFVVLDGAKKPLTSMNGAMTGYYAVNFPDEKDGPWHLIAQLAEGRSQERLQARLRGRILASIPVQLRIARAW